MKSIFLLNRKKFQILLQFVTLPSLLIGIYTMVHLQVPATVWVVNLVTGLLCCFISVLFGRKFFPSKKLRPYLLIFIGLFFILLTFAGSGLMNVHRWVSLGSLQFNSGLIFSPLILIQISKIKNVGIGFCISIFTTILFMFQPDASSVMAFSVASVILLFEKTTNKTILVSASAFTIFATAYSWYNLDGLAPVSYVEGILKLIWQISPDLFIFSLVSLLLLIYPFFANGLKKSTLAISLGLYFALLIVSSFLGNFPVIIIGYGISPIIGYTIGQVYLLNESYNL
jgi:cell division protein FtsW (lipid II flippase)